MCLLLLYYSNLHRSYFFLVTVIKCSQNIDPVSLVSFYSFLSYPRIFFSFYVIKEGNMTCSIVR